MVLNTWSSIYQLFCAILNKVSEIIDTINQRQFTGYLRFVTHGNKPQITCLTVTTIKHYTPEIAPLNNKAVGT